MKVYAPSHELQDLEQKLADINKEEAALAGEDFEKCASLRDAGKKVSSEIWLFKKKQHDDETRRHGKTTLPTSCPCGQASRSSKLQKRNRSASFT